MQRDKSVKIAISLGIVPGFFGWLGIGHLYAGRIRRGLILLIGGWVLAGVSLFCYIAGSMSGIIIPPEGEPVGEVTAYFLLFWFIGFVLLLGGLALWIWQIVDARAVCRQHNRQTSEPTPTSSQ